MNTQLTVADVRSVLEPIFGPNSFMAILNDVRERAFISGKWKGAVVEVDFDSSSGFITLPYEVECVLAMTYNRMPALTYTQFHTYTINGPGEIQDTLNWPGVLIDMGDGFVTQVDISTTGVLKIVTDAADDGKQIRLFGKDENGDQIFDSDGLQGELITCATPFVNTTHQFSVLTGIQATPDPATVMQKFWSIYDAGNTLLSTYYPGESRPCYRRYRTGQAEQAIRLICQRRFIPVRNESDWVWPDSMAALRIGFQAWKFDDGSDSQKAEENWSRYINLLNQEAKYSRGGGIPSTSFINWGVMGGCFGTGWTQPGLVSL
jgi:hypothetical protein